VLAQQKEQGTIPSSSPVPAHIDITSSSQHQAQSVVNSSTITTPASQAPVKEEHTQKRRIAESASSRNNKDNDNNNNNSHKKQKLSKSHSSALFGMMCPVSAVVGKRKLPLTVMWHRGFGRMSFGAERGSSLCRNFQSDTFHSYETRYTTDFLFHELTLSLLLVRRAQQCARGSYCAPRVD
jgi:hypothetical protein